MTIAAAIRELRILRIFTIIWFGQFVSLLGSGLTGFALDLWVYQQTGSVTQYALIALFNTVPPILFAPVAGTLVDRWDKRWTMIISDFGAALATLAVAILFFTSQLQVWHICIAISIISVCNAFQRLASTTVTTLLVPERHLGHATGMMQIGESFAEIFVPAIAGILILTIQLKGILLIDCVTYFFSLGTLLLIKFPQPKSSTKTTTEGDEATRSVLKDTVYGWKYTVAYPGLLALLLYFVACNFVIGVVSVLLIPMLLTFASSATAGSILSFGGIGTLMGSVVMGIWGGPKRRIHGILGFGILLGICIIFAGTQPSIPLVTGAVFGGLFCFPLIAGCSQVLLLSKVEAAVQGRVFALQGMIATSSLPLAYLVAGPLADKVFEPLLANGGLLADSVGKIIGVGTGRGIGLLFIVLGMLQIIVTIYSYFYQPLRHIDKAPIPSST